MSFGVEKWVLEVVSQGYKIPFTTQPPLSLAPIPFSTYQKGSDKEIALGQEVLAMLNKNALQLAPTDPGFYSQIFVVQKPNSKWRPIIDLSILNKYLSLTPFRMETPTTVLNSIRAGDWMVLIDLKDAYLQIPIHPSLRKYRHLSLYAFSIFVVPG